MKTLIVRYSIACKQQSYIARLEEQLQINKEGKIVRVEIISKGYFEHKLNKKIRWHKKILKKIKRYLYNLHRDNMLRFKIYNVSVELWRTREVTPMK